MHTFRTSRGVSADPGRPHLILVGLPGSGKSTVGRAVAKRLGRAFLDFDREIERRERRTVRQIFATNGELHFRSLERVLTEELARVGHMILAPGGGWVVQPEVVALLRPPGRLVYLSVRPDIALARLGSTRTTRPLLARPDPAAALRRLLAERSDTYASAEHIVDTELFDLDGVIERVVALASEV